MNNRQRQTNKRQTKTNKTKDNKNTMKLPENILYSSDGETLQQATKDFVAMLTKEYKVKAIKDEESGAEKKPQEIVRDLLTANFRNKDNAFELPDEMNHLEELNGRCWDIAEEHRGLLKEQADAEQQAKDAKKQERDLAKEAKAAEEKQFNENQGKFEEVFLAKSKAAAEKTAKGVQAALASLSLPKSITLSVNGMGVVLSDNATKEDIATASAAITSATEGNKFMAAALQFVMGDLVNAAVVKKVYRTKGDACKNIKFLIEEKLKKNYSAGAINAYALMSERVPVEKRIMGANPSLYYLASKVVAPKLENAKEQPAMNEKFDAERNNVIDKIVAGEITNVKEVDAHVKTFKESVGLIASTPSDTRKQIDFNLRRLFFAVWSKANLADAEGTVKFRECGTDPDVGAVVEYSVGELTDIEQSALNNLQNMLLAKEDVAALIAGTKEIEITEEKEDEKGKKKKVTTKKTVDALLFDPFETPSEAPKKTAEPVKEEEEEEEEG